MIDATWSSHIYLRQFSIAKQSETHTGALILDKFICLLFFFLYVGKKRNNVKTNVIE